MYDLPSDSRAIITSDNRRECAELRLVLESAGVASKLIQRDHQWILIVGQGDAARAAAEIQAYADENSDPAQPPRQSIPKQAGAIQGVAGYAAIILLVALLAAPWAFDYDMTSVGRVQAGMVVDGQWWRAVTGLTLHADALHLMSNLMFGGLFGILAGRTFGGGIAWLAITLAGSLGNLVAAYLRRPEFSSIGASTAVMAALGMVVAYSLIKWSTNRETLLRRWSPLIGGVVLLAFVGVGGERTDVLAHTTGFVSGCLAGMLCAGLPSRWLINGQIQQGAGIAAVALVVIAWALAITG